MLSVSCMLLTFTLCFCILKGYLIKNIRNILQINLDITQSISLGGRGSDWPRISPDGRLGPQHVHLQHTFVPERLFPYGDETSFTGSVVPSPSDTTPLAKSIVSYLTFFALETLPYRTNAIEFLRSTPLFCRYL